MDFQWHHAQPGSMSLSLIWGHCWSGIVQAVLMDYFWPTGLLFAILAFAIFRPLHSYTIASIEVARWFLDPHEYRRWVPDPSQLDRSLVVFVAYTASLLFLRGARLFWSYLLKAPYVAAWNHPLVTAAIITALYVLKRSLGFTYVLLKVIVFLQWLHGTTLHGFERYKWMAVDGIKRSVLFRVWTKTSECLLNGVLEILGRKQYSRLDAFSHPKMNSHKQIRLLDVRRNIPLLPLRAALVVVDIDDPPPYEAVSYTWDPDPTEHLPVAINGMQHSVPRNVHDILSRLGSTFSRRYIWIDSICINQSDEAEKVHQIKLMRHVYHRAFRVLACLGESRKTGYAAALLNMLIIWKWKFGTVGAALQTIALMQNRRSNHFLEANFTGFFELLDHRWFERAWVVQEVVFARQLTLHQRNYTWIWEYFLEAIEVLIDPSVPEIASIFESSMSYGVSRHHLPYGLSHGLMMARTRALYQHGGREPLYVILQRFTAFKATNDHDKIFALLGFIDNDLDHLIDYNRPIECLLIEIAKYLLAQGDLVHVLHLAGTGYFALKENQVGYSKALLGLPLFQAPLATELETTDSRQGPTAPYWVPDWRVSRTPRTLAHSGHMPHLQYRAASNIEARMYVSSDDPQCLRSVGHIVDSIRHAGATSRAAGVVDGLVQVMVQTHFHVEWLAEAQALAANFAAPAQLGDSHTTEEAVWRTVLGDRTQTARPIPRRLIHTMRSIHSSIDRIHDAAQRIGLQLGGDLSRLETHLVEHPHLFQDALREMQDKDFWESGTCLMLIGDPEYPRRFCVTAEGRIGLVPHNALAGDLVVVLHGAQVPFVIRPSAATGGRQYELVGECYVHGLMDGEALNLRLPSTEFAFI